MAISKELFLAILSMDSYNRGYLVGLNLTGSQIGNATIIDDANTPPTRDAGFYAVAYSTAGVNGFSAQEKTIAYRGTDQLFAADGIGGDVWNAYGVGFGSPGGAQAALALQFFQQVAGQNVDPRTANISLTGHSSGGGLAGLVGGLYGKYGALFDNMAFEGAATVEVKTGTRRLIEYLMSPVLRYRHESLRER